MIRIILIFFSFLIILNLRAQQNLLSNSGFENSSPTNYLPTCYGSDFDKLTSWKNQIYKSDQNSQTGCYGIVFHSPDWFYNSSIGHNSINAFEGTHYVGMGDYELMQQHLSTKFSNDEVYYILKFRLAFDDRLLNSSAYNHYYNSVIKIYCSKKEIKYKSDDKCTDDYKKFKNQVGQNIKNISSASISSFTISTQQQTYWNEVTIQFQSPGHSYDWFAIQVENIEFYSDCNQSYICLDDFSLTETECINGCSGVDGNKMISCTNFHSDTAPLTFSGLNNVSHVDLRINMDGGGEIFNKSVDNPKNSIAWNGRNLAGGEVAPAWYEYDLDVTNDCGTLTYSNKFSKGNSAFTPTLWSPLFNWGGVSKPPDICCESDILIENQILLQDKTINQPLLYKGMNTITAGPNVQINNINNNTVLFEAGFSINLLPGFNVEAGADFTAQIVSCEGNKNMVKNNTLSDFNLNEFDTVKDSNEKFDTVINSNQEESSISISPNPFRDFSFIELKLIYNSNITIEIKNVYGGVVKKITSEYFTKGIFSIALNAIELISGVYICSITTNQEKWNIEIIIAK